jgi:hypothetical protein
VSWTSIGGILGEMTGAAAEAKQCEWITHEPVYIKRIGNMVIDRSEWENEHGAFLCNRDIPCRYVADPGHKYCPRHEMEAAMKYQGDGADDSGALAPKFCPNCGRRNA